MKAGIVIGHLNNAGNEAALLRSAEAFGINHVYVWGTREPSYDISQGADGHMTFFEFDTEESLIGHLRDNNQTVVAVENADGAIAIGNGERYPTNPVFVVGEEGQGVPAKLAAAAEQVRIIPQAATGYVTCLNTTVAGSIVISDWYQDCRDRTQTHLEPRI